jgi:hypothetical protein
MVTGNGNLTINADPPPSFQLSAANSGAAGLIAGSAGLLSSRADLRTGQLLVAIQDSQGAVTADEQARIDDAIGSIDAALKPFGVELVDASGGNRSAATIHLNIASTTDVGGVASGVLAVTEHGNSITIVSGWNWYLGADPGAVGPDQYDFQTVVAHELGHTVGLGEGSDPASVMYPFLATGVARRTMSGNDLAVIASYTGDGTVPLPADVGSGVARPSFSAVVAVPVNSGGNTNAQLAAFLTLFDVQGQKLDAQVVETALNVFATSVYVGGAAAEAYGFTVNAFGVGADSWNVDSTGEALGVPSGTTPNLFQNLLAPDNFAVGGESWDSAMTQRILADAVFDGINLFADSD